MATKRSEKERWNILIMEFDAISYMHHDCIPILVNQNISNNNTLLNSEVEAFVSDFGKARLLDPDSSNQTLIAWTCGYIALGELFFSYYILYLPTLQHIILKS
ncbi:mdis1-interacting receptor like kinase 2 [Quercus suber]|uniref:non-specific serine/threonine protein kinase n=1 Tax=Quercus suber TaxID=58331 RepID=A0AAW0LG01_QUESU